LVEKTFADGARQWQKWRTNLQKASRADSAARIADLVLQIAGIPCLSFQFQHFDALTIFTGFFTFSPLKSHLAKQGWDSMKPKVLIVDDDQEFVQLLEFNLEREGCEIFTATNGVQALHHGPFALPTLSCSI